MADLGLHAHGADHAPHVVDLLGQRARGRVAAVQVLGADGDGDDPVVAVGVDGRLQRVLLRRVVRGVLGPHADEDLGARRERGGHGVLQRVAVRGGVQADGSDVLGQAFELVEGGLPIGLRFARAVLVVGSDVEAGPVGARGGQGGREGGEGGGKAHTEEL